MDASREGCTFRPMEAGDVAEALDIINDHDEDDYAWAKATYDHSLYGQFVLEKDGQMLGVTGAKPIDGTDRSFSISWTYLQRQFIGHGYGRILLESVIREIQSLGCRKVFVNTSDYIDPEEGDIYRDAREAYRAVGFAEEMRQKDYYDRGEAQISLGLRLQEPVDQQVQQIQQNIRLTDIDEIDECQGAYYLAWELDDEGSDASGFEMIIDQVKSWEGRCIFMAFPSDVANAASFARTGKFNKSGVLLDYYEDGVDEVFYRYDLY